MKILALPRPKKSLGQHFLTDPAICLRIARILEPCREDKIIEIGPGPGGLTRALEALPHSLLLLLEKDGELCGRHGRAAKENSVVLNMDALAFAWDRLQVDENWKIIGNLPYNIASPLIWNILSQCRGLKKAVFMTQKEVALRLTANPGSRAYGALTAWVKNFSQPRLEFSLAPGAFTPPPKVHSAVVSFLPKSQPCRHPAKLKKLLNLCFQKRRKQLGAIFQQAGMSCLKDGLQSLGIPADKRPENLTPEIFCQLAGFWQE